MNPSHVQIASSGKGRPTLYIRGEWSPDGEAAFDRSDWEALAILGVEWPDYRCLIPYADRIKHLRVPFGPDSSRGLDELTNLEILESRDVFAPAVDFRRLTHLKYLEAIWDKKKPEYFSHTNVETMIVHRVSGNGLDWLPDSGNLKKLQLIGGRVKSLDGLQHARNLSELYTMDLHYCSEVEAATVLPLMQKLRLDTPKALLQNLDWVSTMPQLSELEFAGTTLNVDWERIGSHPRIRYLGIKTHEGYSASDEEILVALRRGGRTVSSFQRLTAKIPNFIVEFGGAGNITDPT